ncbi:MAG: ferrous iron transport protein A [Acholeplasmatales bacterium]|nr:ferrous iron transport protein A [Acholeplasmatales bacterium]
MENQNQKITPVLSQLKPGQTCVVTKVNGEGRLRRRLFDMGVTPGAEIAVVKKAPLGDPVQVTIRNYELTLRKNESALVEVEITSEDKSLDENITVEEEAK